MCIGDLFQNKYLACFNPKYFLVRTLQWFSSSFTYGTKFGFFLCSLDCLKLPKIEYPIYKFLYPIISGTISRGLLNQLIWLSTCDITREREQNVDE